MKKISILILSLILFTPINKVYAVVSSVATVQINVKTTDGEPIANQEITCWDKPPDTPDGYPGTPEITYLTTNSNGIATWNVTVKDGHSYKCTSRTALTSDYCYSLGSPNPSNLSLSPGQTATVNITATYAPSTCTKTDNEEPTEKTDKKKEKTTTTPNTIQPTDDKEKEPELAKITNAQIPEEFKKEGSKTTDLTEITKDEAKNFKDFTIDNVSSGTIVFKDTVDLSENDLEEKFNNLDKYVEISKGKISVNSKELPEFKDKKARITFHNLNIIIDNLKILHNGENLEIKEENELIYKDGKLSLTVDSFSNYEIAPNLKIASIEQNADTIDVIGQITDKDSIIEIFINNKKQDININIEEDGSFTTKLIVNKRTENNIKFTATSKNGIVESIEKDIEAMPYWSNLWVLGVMFFLLSIILGITAFFLSKKLTKRIRKRK